MVTETHVKRGNTVVMRYKAFVEPSKEGKYFAGRRDYELVSFNGIAPQSNPALAKQLVPLIAQLSTRPRAHIDKNGEILGVEDWTGYLDRLGPVLDDFVDKYSMDQDVIDATMLLMRNPSNRPILESRATEFWSVWISSWRNYDFNKAPEFRFEGEFLLPTNRVVKGPWKAQHHGSDEEHEGCVRVSVEGSLGGKKLVDAVKASMEGLSAMVPHSTPIPDDALERMSVESRAWIILRPKTMQPVEAYTERRILIGGAVEQSEEVETRHYTFDW